MNEMMYIFLVLYIFSNVWLQRLPPKYLNYKMARKNYHGVFK